MIVSLALERKKGNIAMKKIILTDPFTGIDFEAYTFDDESILAIHPLTGETIIASYDAATKRFMLPVEALEHIDTVTLKEAAEFMNVSVQSVSHTCSRGKLPVKVLPNGTKVIVKKDLQHYNDTKRIGRPRKENANEQDR